MKVFVLGSTTQVGKYLCEHLPQYGFDITTQYNSSNINPLDKKTISEAFRAVDVVINCYAYDKNLISKGSTIAVDAALSAGMPNMVLISTKAVYGGKEGVLNESSELDPDYNAYTLARCHAELEVKRYSQNGGKAIILRPGCIMGAGSFDWMTRIVNLLSNKRIGYLGKNGDGWTNFTLVNDIAKAVIKSIEVMNEKNNFKDVPCYNLTSYGSPRWNEYLHDVALMLGITPIQYINTHTLNIDSKVYSVIIRLTERVLGKLGLSFAWLPATITPSLIKLLRLQVRVDSSKIERELGLTISSYQDCLTETISWYKQSITRDS